MKKFMTLLVSSLLVALAVSSADARMWKNKQGKSVNAHYLTSDAKTIILVLDKDGREVVVQKDQFSDEDLQYVEEQEVLLTIPAYEELGPDLKKKDDKASGGEWKRGI